MSENKNNYNSDFLTSIEEVLEDAKKGKMFILVDDEDRENEGDLCILGEYADSESINFMAKFGRGLICLALERYKAEELGLEMMQTRNPSKLGTAFTVSIEANEGVTTGISAADRAKTISVAINKNARPNDLSTPGHIFPLIAKDGGVLERAGHTEAAVDLSRLANGESSPFGVICEIMNDDGSMARFNDLKKFCIMHNLKMSSIKDLIEYKLKKDKFVKCIKVDDLHFPQGRRQRMR